MRVLVLDFSNQVREGFITALIPAGFEVVAIKEKKELLPMLAKKPFDIAVIDVNEQDKEGLQLIKIMRSDNRFAHIKIIVHTSAPSKEFIISLIKMGVAGYLLKPFSDRGLLQRFQNVLAKAKVEIKERKHVRVKPAEGDGLTVTFRSPSTHKVISGDVADISAGGVAFSLFGNVGEKDVQIRQFINNFQIQLGKTRASTPALVIARKNKLVAVQYFKIQEYDLNILCKYIYERLAAESK